MSKFEVKCTRPGCGQGMETPDIDEMMAWSAAHDEACPALKALEVAPGIIAEAEKRGAVKALRMADDRLLTERDELRTVRARHDWPMGVEDAARTVRSLADAIQSGEVTL